jgi:hypothetical protein
MVFYLPFRGLFGQGGTAYNKYAIVARTEPELLTLMICTEIPRFAFNNDKLRRSYVQIPVASHAFLERDSWVDCNDAKDEYSLGSLLAAYRRDSSCYVGDVTTEVLRQIVGGIDRSVKLERKKKSSISRALNQAINSR